MSDGKAMLAHRGIWGCIHFRFFTFTIPFQLMRLARRAPIDMGVSR